MVPHVGWNSLCVEKDSPLLANIPEGAMFYYDHSYCVTDVDDSVTEEPSDDPADVPEFQLEEPPEDEIPAEDPREEE